MKTGLSLLLIGGLGVAGLQAQEPNPTQTVIRQSGDAPQPIFRVTVVSRTTKAVNFHHRKGSTMVDFRGTALMPLAKGDAKVESNTGATKVQTHFEKIGDATQFGPGYLTYVLWAITPEGRAVNMGEVVKNDDGRSHIEVATDLQAFGMIVTAEPYWAVTEPSDVVVMENFVRNDTTGTIEEVDAKYELLQRGMYEGNVNLSKLEPSNFDSRVPLQLREARTAVSIARFTGADKYAADTYQKALIDLQNANDYFSNKHGDKKSMETNAREAVQMSEDARIITIRKMRAEALDAERQAAADKVASANASADEAARQRALAEQQRLQAQQQSAQSEAERLAADKARMEADEARKAAEAASALAQRDRAAAEADRAAAEAARQAALAQQQAAQADADKMRLAAQQAEAEKQELRQKLLTQLNMILATRDSARGLIVNMSDVLFDFNKSTLRAGAREKLAKITGIVLAYPTLKLAIEGHTDSIGTDVYNQTLSEKRAYAVRDYLTAQGLNAASLTAIGLGKADPVASNDTAAGRQQNRRVEMVVSGEVIGTPLAPGLATAPTAAR